MLHLTTQPYQEVFVELAGDYQSKATDGFALDYDGQIQVTQLQLMKKMSENDCD